MYARPSLALRKLLSEFPFRRSTSRMLSRNLSTYSNRCSPHRYSEKRHHFYRPSVEIPLIRTGIFQDFRSYSAETDKEVDRINIKFAEAREEIESALDSKETVYFNEEAECAREAVDEVLKMYGDLLKKLPESERGAIRRAMGLKIEQLKAELEQLND